MARSAVDIRQQSSHPAAKRASAENGFKPVALPALAAAMRPRKPAQPRKPNPQDIPAILREDSILG